MNIEMSSNIKIKKPRKPKPAPTKEEILAKMNEAKAEEEKFLMQLETDLCKIKSLVHPDTAAVLEDEIEDSKEEIKQYNENIEQLKAQP